MDRKRSFQARFERAKTPMGAVPISVIMGFDYPLGDTEPCGRGEASSSSSYSYSCKPSYTSSYTSSYPSTLTSNYSNYRDTNMLERIPRPPTQRTAAATPAYRTPGQRQYLAELGLSSATPEKRPLVTTTAQVLLLNTPNSSPATTPPPSACPPPRCPAGRAGQGLWRPPLPRPGDRLHSSPGHLPRPIHLLTQARPAAATTDSPLSGADFFRHICSRFI